ncbi:MAG: segregation and condensation protein [Rhodospirillales bacterium]|nr:segregation and condensation protein [Rhodospirillales bacterium]
MTDRGQDLRLVEALLFASAHPLDDAALAARLPEGSDVVGLVAELTEIYRNRGVNVVRISGGWSFRTAPDLAPRLNLERVLARKLSRAAIETLAIIAYHQPVTRGEIEEIRGVVINRGTLDTLMEAGWVRPKGHRQTPGRPATWVTTPEFLLHFGLDNLTDLPGVDELKAAGLLDSRPSATLGEMIAEPESATDEGEESDDELGDDEPGADDAGEPPETEMPAS